MRILLAACLFFTTCILASAQAAFQDPLLEHLTGQWVLSGTMDGKQTTHDITADWVLNHEYIQLHEVSREKDVQGHPAYEAIVLIGWDKKLSQYACLWLDNTSGDGVASKTICRGKGSGNEIAFLFTYADGSVFHNTFAYDPADNTWKWRLDGEDHGKLQPFARVTLKRR